MNFSFFAIVNIINQAFNHFCNYKTVIVKLYQLLYHVCGHKHNNIIVRSVFVRNICMIFINRSMINIIIYFKYLLISQITIN